ncbi:radical SAM protein [Chitinispirillales bacterium ANBcel5]|uniref:radical SAM protein n=1 Tax=Cellulosispirillum alkaliphilum TaxID=3039283 RepID=UPI002A5396C5|nr:radical SAM protein [Chitinispirillales bacterium ANBcel5]
MSIRQKPPHSHQTNQIRLVAWEVTRSCNLKCRHCRASAGNGPYKDEFSTEECEQVLTNIASFAKPIVILTGGEPMLRPDIYHLAKLGTDLGLKMVMAPCGTFLTPLTCIQLKMAGIQRISLSLDGATARTHDKFRGVEGAFTSVLAGAAAARAAQLEFQINTTVTRINVGELSEIFELAKQIGAVSFHPFLLVPTGRGKQLADFVLSAQEYERVLNWVYEKRGSEGISIKPTCAPHYYRVLRQREREAGRTVSYQSHGLDAVTRGCLGGHGFAFISHTGSVQMCGFLEKSAGNLRDTAMDFKAIWHESIFFKEIRNIANYKGRCGICKYRTVCGGCRARAFAISGNYYSEEPFCIYEPKVVEEKACE